MRAILALAAGLVATSAAAQQTKSLAPGARSPAATVDRLAWLTGRWRGEGIDGAATEVYSAPTAGQIAGHFIQVRAGKVAFYELMQIVPEGGSLTYRLRHFNADLTGWEDAKGGRAVTFRLVTLDKDTAWFDGLTYRRTGIDTMEAWVKIDGDPPHEQVFRYRRVAE